MTEPNQWKVVHYANVGMSEEFVEYFVGELHDLVNATLIFEPERRLVNEEILGILMEGLIPAFEHLKKIRSSVTQNLPVLNRMQLYEDFSRVLWHAYKDLMPKATLLLGFDVGFLFQNDSNFEKGVIEFNRKHPSLIGNVGDFLRNQRANWQNGLAKFRNNYLEHKQEEQKKLAKYYNPAEAEILFDSAWRTMAYLFAVFIESHFPPNFSIEPIPANEQSGVRRRQYRFVVR